MKNKIIQTVFLITLAFGLAAHAQAQNPTYYRVHIPFDFNVGKKLFQAGDYSINFGGLANSRETFILRADRGKDAAILNTMPEEKSGKLKNSVLVFELYENQYRLAEIKTPFLEAKFRRSKAKSRAADKFKQVEIILAK